MGKWHEILLKWLQGEGEREGWEGLRGLGSQGNAGCDFPHKSPPDCIPSCLRAGYAGLHQWGEGPPPRVILGVRVTRNPAAQPGPWLHAQGSLRARPCAGSPSEVTAAGKLALCDSRALLAPGTERNASSADPAPHFLPRPPPSAPPPSSHRAPLEQASLEPLPLANGKRWLRRRARRRAGQAQD